MSRKLFIEGIDYTSDVLGIEKFELEVFLNESTHTIDRVISSTVELKGAAALLIKKTFFEDCTKLTAELKATFYEENFQYGVPMLIKADAVKFCFGSCRAEVGLSIEDDETTAYNRLDGYFFYDKGFLPEMIEMGAAEKLNQRLALVPFCDQPSFMQIILFYIRQYMGVSASILFKGFKLITDVVSEIIEFFADLFGKKDVEVDLNPLNNLFESLDNYITGCGKAVWSPLVREVLRYQCAAQGIEFKSSILDNPSSPYYNMCILSLESGRSSSLSNKVYVKEDIRNNLPGWTTIDLLNELLKTFGGDKIIDFRIMNKTLFFEEKPFFNTLDVPLFIDLNSLEEEQSVRMCYSYSTDNLCAYGDFKFSLDPLDGEGNKVKRLHRDIVEFNEPYNKAQKGKCVVLSPFAPVRAMFDQESFEKNGFFDYERGIDLFRSGDSNFIKDFFALSNSGTIRQQDIILERGQTTVPKLLILEDNYDSSEALVKRRKIGDYDEKQYYNYNYDLYYQQNYEVPELVQRYLFKLNPRIGDVPRFKLDDVDIPMTCARLDLVFQYGINVKIETHLGTGRANKIVLKFQSGIISLQDIEIWCD